MSKIKKIVKEYGCFALISFGLNGNSMEKETLIERLRQFLEAEARSCSMEPGCITPMYVFRMWGGKVPLDEIEEALNSLEAVVASRNFILHGNHGKHGKSVEIRV